MQRKKEFPQAAPRERSTDLEYVRQALEACERSSIIPGVIGPYRASTLIWKGVRYYYVSGLDKDGQTRLVEVFQVGRYSELEALLAFQYPAPFKELFPEDYSVLYSDDPWGERYGT